MNARNGAVQIHAVTQRSLFWVFFHLSVVITSWGNRRRKSTANFLPCWVGWWGSTSAKSFKNIIKAVKLNHATGYHHFRHQEISRKISWKFPRISGKKKWPLFFNDYPLPTHLPFWVNLFGLNETSFRFELTISCIVIFCFTQPTIGAH